MRRTRVRPCTHLVGLQHHGSPLFDAYPILILKNATGHVNFSPNECRELGLKAELQSLG